MNLWRPVESNGDKVSLLHINGDHWRPAETSGDHSSLVETSTDLLRLLESSGDQRSQCGPLKTSGDLYRPVEIRGDQWRPVETSLDWWRKWILVDTSGNQQRLMEASRN